MESFWKDPPRLSVVGSTYTRVPDMKALKKPPALHLGDRIGVIVPSSPVKEQLLLKGAQELERIGYEPVFAEGILARHGFFAGEHARRAEAILAFMEDPTIKAIFGARGGYGSNH